MRRPLIVLLFTLLPLAARIDTASAQLPARVAAPYTLMDIDAQFEFEY